MRYMPVMRRQAPVRREPRAELAPRDGTERDGHERRPVRGMSERARRYPAQLPEQFQCERRRCLALIHRHPGGRVALDVLNGSEVLANGKLEVRDCHIVQKINPFSSRVADGADARTDWRSARG